MLDMAAELGALTPKLATLPGTTACSTIANLLPALIGEARNTLRPMIALLASD